jgi:hypothetical protein
VHDDVGYRVLVDVGALDVRRVGPWVSSFASVAGSSAGVGGAAVVEDHGVDLVVVGVGVGFEDAWRGAVSGDD